MNQSANSFYNMVEQSFGYLKKDFGFETRNETSGHFRYDFFAPHITISFWYGKMELDIILERKIHTKILRPFHNTTYCLRSFVRSQITKPIDYIPTNIDFDELNYWGKAFHDYCNPLLKQDFKALEQYALIRQKRENRVGD